MLLLLLISTYPLLALTSSKLAERLSIALFAAVLPALRNSLVACISRCPATIRWPWLACLLVRH